MMIQDVSCADPPDPLSVSRDTDWDVVIIGAGFSGESAGILMRRLAPCSRVLIVERSERYGRKVGEATVEVSACFLHRELGLYDYLSREHLPKHGLRYWFTDDSARSLHEMSEIGPHEVPRLPSFQLDRSKLDEHLLHVARQAGCSVSRPAKVTGLELGWPTSTLCIADSAGQDERRVTTRWVIDASGRRSWVAKALDLRRRVPAHPTTALWARWRGVADIDGDAFNFPGADAEALPAVAASRRLATNHFCGYGWWCWVIPLHGGETSIGLVLNSELADMPAHKFPRERYCNFLMQQSGLRELLAGAEIVDDDFLALKHVPYTTTRYADLGWALVGDAASFMDPYYSPGLDHAAMSVTASVRIIAADIAGSLDEAALTAQVEEHNARFLRSYERWLGALYLDKYELMGDAELTACAYWFDTAMYYLGIVGPVYADSEALAHPVFGLPIPQATVAFRLMRFFNRRMLAIARRRRLDGRYGRRNTGWRCYTRSFGLGTGALPPLLRGLRLWAKLELEQFASRIASALSASRPPARA